MTETSKNNLNQGISPIELMIVLTVVSTLFLPCMMYFTEWSKGSSKAKDKLLVLSLVEERLEKILAMPFKDIPEGKSSNITIESQNGKKVDLGSLIIATSNKKVSFECLVETVPVDFSAIKNYSLHNIQRVSVENGMKKITISAQILDGENKQTIQLMAYKANL